MRVALGLVAAASAALFAAGCSPHPALSPHTARCARRPTPKPRETPFDPEIDFGAWQIEGGLPPKAELRVCDGVDAGEVRVRRGPLAAAYETRSDEAGRLAQLGGNYWRAPYAIGSSNCRLDTRGRGSDKKPGSILSPEVANGERYVSLLVGGGGGDGTRVELCAVESGHCSPALPGTVIHGPGVIGLERVTWDLRTLGLEGRRIRVRVAVDAAAGAGGALDFLLADGFLAGDVRPPAKPARLWGFVDLHAHLFNQIGSGGRLIHGGVFARCDPSHHPNDCDDPLAQMKRALGTTCVDDHGHAGLTFSVEPLGHDTTGFPSFKGWPTFDSISHQQAYVDWIERAYRGGLRLVQMDVGNNRTYAAAYEQLNGGMVPPLPQSSRHAGDGLLTRSADEDTVRAEELAEMRLFVAPGGPASAWADVAYSSADARRIALAGKMVIVPGVESDNPSDADDVRLAAANHLPTYEARRIVRAYVERLHGEGIRHVFPVHVMPNVFGEPAVFDRTIYCAALPEEGQLQPLAEGMGADIRYHVEKDPGMMGGLVDFLMTNILDPLPRSVALRDRNAALGSFAKGDCLKWNFPDLRAFDSTLRKAVRSNSYALQATMAKRGLTPVGKLFVEEAMRLGMLIDLTHMGDRSRADTLEIANRYAYPLMASHVNLRELAFGNTEKAPGTCEFAPPPEPFDPGNDAVKQIYGTSVVTKVGYEYALRRSEVDQISRLGGMVGLAFELSGVGVEWAAEGAGKATPIDCDGTSKSFAQPYRYLNDLMGHRGIAFGTDVNGFYMLPPPRFGAHACAGACEKALADDLRCGANHGGPGNQPQTGAPAVAYDSGPPPSPRQARRFHASTVKGGKTFDVNVDGVAHYGLLPDFLQDLVNVGVSPEELATLFGGLEDYLEMWASCEEQAAVVRAAIP